jgi:hypothetical protein
MSSSHRLEGAGRLPSATEAAGVLLAALYVAITETGEVKSLFFHPP